MNKYNVIGDIHGRTKWKQLVQDDCVNVFIGDYFDPYSNISFDDCKQNFLEIVEYKKQYPETILLIGNHDDAYIHDHVSYSRHNRGKHNEIKQLFINYANLFQMAFATKHYLLTHAGVTEDWIKGYVNVEKTPTTIAIEINNLWKSNYEKAFNFDDNSEDFDYYGTSRMQSCVWVRPKTLVDNNIFKDTEFKQIVGHTQFKEIFEFKNIIFVDVLETIDESFKFED